MKKGAWVLLSLLGGVGLREIAAAPPDDVRAFHQRLIAQEPDWFEGGGDIVKAYYTVLEGAPLSVPHALGEERWTCSNVRFNNSPIGDQNGLALTINNIPLPESLLAGATLPLPVRRGGQTQTVLFRPTVRRNPVLHAFNTFQAFAQGAGHLTYAASWRGTLPPDDEHDEEGGDITFDTVYGKRCPLRARAMAVTYRKDRHQTRLFFDFSDAQGRPLQIYGMAPMEQPRQTPRAVPQEVYRIIDHKLYAFDPKVLTYALFASDSARAAWISAGQRFYEADGQITNLPLFSTAHMAGGQLRAEVLWAFNADDPVGVFYEGAGANDTEGANEHLYSNGLGTFFLPRRALRTQKRYCQEGNAPTERALDFLSAVPKLAVALRQGCHIEGGHRLWPQGAYRQTNEGIFSVWSCEASNEKVRIDPTGSTVFEFLFTPDANLSAAESYTQCSAMQRSSFLTSYDARIFRLNRPILSGLREWNKLKKLDLISLRLERASWSEVLQALGAMNWLTELRFCDNSVIGDPDSKYQALAERTSNHYVSCGLSFGKLTQLRRLEIQGLWLRPESFFGGYTGALAKQVGMLTGTINHDHARGVRAVIEGICRLPLLESLSMDGIPNEGTGFMARADKASVATAVIGIELLSGWPGSAIFWGVVHRASMARQSSGLKELAEESADKLARRPSLRRIEVYAPGGDKFDLFSQFFWDRLRGQKPNLEGGRYVLR